MDQPKPVTISTSALGLVQHQRAHAPADLPAAECPPARLDELTQEDLALVLVAIDGLALSMQTILVQSRRGTRAAHDAAHIAGRLTVIAGRIRRHVATLTAA